MIFSYNLIFLNYFRRSWKILHSFYTGIILNHSFHSASEVKNPPANAGDARDMGSICGLGRKKVGHDLATKQQQHFKLHICHPFQNKISVSVIRIGHSLVFVFLFLFKLKYYPGPSTGKGVKDLPSPLSRIIH